MTDNEIIKALECHNICRVSKCEECPLFPTSECSAELSGYALDLINRQKAEVERLKYNLEAVLNERADHSEAIKEFAEAFKVKFAKERYRDNYVIDDEMLDNLVKEMVGDTE